MALRFIFEEGIGKSEIVYIDIPDMYARGGAHIDLHTETMKMVLQPKPKKGLRGYDLGCDDQGANCRS